LGVGEAVRKRRKGGLGRAEGARRKFWGQNQGNRNIQTYFQIFFACGALNLLRYRIYEPTPYTTILREPKNAVLRAILHYKMYVLSANCAKFSPAARQTGEEYT